MESKQLALSLAHASLDKQAEDVLILDVHEVSGLTDYFVLCTASNARQMDAVQNHIQAVAEACGAKILHAEGNSALPGAGGEGYDDLRWILLDCDDVVVHVMDADTRAFYRLEHLWADAPKISVKDPACPIENPPA